MESLFDQCLQRLNDNYTMHVNGVCKIWTGCVSKNGYGQLRYRHPRDGFTRLRNTTAHRVALMVHNQNFDIPATMHASHLCNHRACINVDHLIFESSHLNSLRKSCFLHNRCSGHFE